MTFVERGIGDVLIAWENEALLSLKEFGADRFEIVAPKDSILAEPPVAVVDKVADRRGTRKVAEAFLEFLYSAEGQVLAAKNFYRPREASALTAAKVQFPAIELFTIDDLFGGWKSAQEKHFAEGGEFDRLPR